MDGFTNLHHTSESERQVGNTSTNLHIWTLLLDCLGCLDKVNTVICMFFHSSSNGQHIRIENNILWRKLHFIHQNVIRTLADSYFFRFCCCLTFLVECHYYHRCSVLLQQCCLLLKQLLSHLQTDGVHNCLTLAPLQTCHHNLKLRCIKHEWHLGHIWLSHCDLHKLLHCSYSIQQAVIYIDVDHMCSVFHLLLRNVHRSRIVSCHHQLLELQ